MAVYTIAMAFMNYRIIAKSLAAFQDTRNVALENKLVILNQHYPLNYDENQVVLKELAKQHNATLLDAGKNLGLHDGFNFVVDKIKPNDNDILIGYDPDSLPLQYGWDMALVRAIDGDPTGRAIWSSLMNPRSKRDIMERGYEKRKSDGYIEIWETKLPVTNSICAFKAGWLKSIGGLQEHSKYYGHLESCMYEKIDKKKNGWVFLPGWTESDCLRDMHDRDYVIYKWCHSHLKSWDGDFKSWLDAGKPNPENSNKTPAQLP